MGGYAIMAPAALGGPPGWLLWAVGGTAITVGTVVLGREVYEATRPDDRAPPIAPAVPTTDTCVSGNCPRPYSVRIHAQGSDIDGTSGGTKGAPPLVSSTPITVAATLALSQATWAMLTKREKKVRTGVKMQLERWVIKRPTNGFLGQKSFEVPSVRGGIRYDIDSFGTSPNLIS